MSSSLQRGAGNAGALAVFGLAVALLAALFPPPAAASSAAFTIRGTNGFRVDVASEHGTVTVAASERRPPFATFSPAGRPRPAGTDPGASSVYFARSTTAAPTEIGAGLGALGRIAVSFRPSGATRVTVLGPGDGTGPCAEGTRIVRRLGTFTGTIEFEGEGGYTTVQAQRARGSIGTPLPPGCGAGARRQGRLLAGTSNWPGPGAAVLRAVNRRASTSFKALTTATGVSFLATLEERLDGGLLVVRRACAGAPPGTFVFNRGLTAARVRPPAPFSGSARFGARGGRGGAWVGSLTATFPGGHVAMAGPGFVSSLRPDR